MRDSTVNRIWVVRDEYVALFDGSNPTREKLTNERPELPDHHFTFVYATASGNHRELYTDKISDFRQTTT
jgi:hypothetical protein